jgi:hypothetical protein
MSIIKKVKIENLPWLLLPDPRIFEGLLILETKKNICVHLVIDKVFS